MEPRGLWNTRDSTAIQRSSRFLLGAAQRVRVDSPSPELGLRTAEEALAVARETGSSVVSLYPLVAVTTAARWLDATRALDAADEALRTDATQRQILSNIVRGNVAGIRVATGQVAEGLAAAREALHSYDDAGERTVFTIHLGDLAATLVPIDPLPAMDLAALAEVDAIAPFAAFGHVPSSPRSPRNAPPTSHRPETAPRSCRPTTPPPSCSARSTDSSPNTTPNHPRHHELGRSGEAFRRRPFAALAAA